MKISLAYQLSGLFRLTYKGEKKKFYKKDWAKWESGLTAVWLKQDPPVVNSRSLTNFSVGILQTLVKLVQVKNLELITCSATGTGMLVREYFIK